MPDERGGEVLRGACALALGDEPLAGGVEYKAYGRSYKMFTVLDEYNREALCVAVRPKMNAHDVLETLLPLLIKHGKPEVIRSDNGPEFIATHLQDWLKRIGIKPMQIYPGSPWECGGIRKQCGTLFSRHMIQRTL